MSTPGAADPGLPAGLLEDTFQRVIVPDYLLRSSPVPQRHPEAVLLGGQPGAGKSTTAAQLQRQFAGRGGIVWVTWDDFRPLHPQYERLLAERPADMPDVTRPAARWWQDRAAAYLRTGGYNTLLEGGFRDPSSVLATAGDFATAGYRVHVMALAVPAALSRLGIIERFARQVEVTGTGRWTTAASHDADYRGTAEVLRQAQAAAAVSRISLWTRDGLVYGNHRGPAGEWAAALNAVAVLQEARTTPLSRLQSTALAHRLADTLARLDAAGQAHPALREMAATIRQDLAAAAGSVVPPLHAAPGPAAATGPSAQAPPGPHPWPEPPQA